MSILIRGMDMPEKNERIRIEICGDGRVLWTHRFKDKINNNPNKWHGIRYTAEQHQDPGRQMDMPEENEGFREARRTNKKLIIKILENALRSDAMKIDHKTLITEPALESIIEVLKEPERKKGKWIYVERKEPQYDIAGVRTWAVVYKCSECGFLHTVIENSGIYDYCPNCGTEMET